MRWKPVVGYEGHYEVSDQMAVRSVDRVGWNGHVYHTIKGRLLSLTVGGNGYLTVKLCKDGKPATKHVHSLVAEAFLGPRPHGYQVCHNDGDRTNARLSNLRYGTPSDNSQDALRHGTHRAGPSKGVKRSDGAVFESLASAANAVGVKYQSITSAIRKGCRSGGHYWEFL